MIQLFEAFFKRASEVWRGLQKDADSEDYMQDLRLEGRRQKGELGNSLPAGEEMLLQGERWKEKEKRILLSGF